jgi:hypothetical protein
MKRRTRPTKILLLCIALSMLCSARVLHGQEVDRDKDESTKTKEEQENDKAVVDVMSGRKIFLPSDSLSRATDRTVYEVRHPNLQPTTFVDFGSNKDGSRKIEFTTNYTYGRFNVGDLNRSNELYNDLDSFVLSGSITKDDLDWFESRKLRFAVWSGYSAKIHGTDAAAAVALTRRNFNPSEILLFDALPTETGMVRGRLELSRMGLPARPKDWLSARQTIRAAANGIPIHIATKPALVKELKDGTATFLLVIAHSDSENLYLPGVNGGRLSLSELTQIQRRDAPDRVIVLLACKVGDVNNRVASIAETILHNKLATAVLASNNYVYAADVSSMIGIFVRSGKLSDAFPGLVTIVVKGNPFQGDPSLGMSSQDFVFRRVTDEFSR